MIAADVTTTPGTPGRLALEGRLFANETAKGLRLTWRRRGLVVTGIVLGVLNYLGINLFIGGGHIVEELMVLTLPGLAAVTVAQAAALSGSGGVAEEINGGTLEQAQLSPGWPSLQVLGRIAALTAEGLVSAAALAVVFIAWFNLDYDWHPAALLPAVLTVLDALGYGLLMIALTVRVASIGAIVHVFNMVIMVFGGMLVPITVFPDGIQTFAHLVPTALGVRAFNATLADGGLGASWSDGTLPWLLVHVAVLWAVGMFVYAATLRRAKREGALNPG